METIKVKNGELLGDSFFDFFKKMNQVSLIPAKSAKHIDKLKNKCVELAQEYIVARDNYLDPHTLNMDAVRRGEEARQFPKELEQELLSEASDLYNAEEDTGILPIPLPKKWEEGLPLSQEYFYLFERFFIIDEE